MRGSRDDDLKREIQAHLELEAEQRVAGGMSPAEARSAAHRAFGNVLRIREDARAVWVAPWLDHTVQDLRYAIRGLRRTPGIPVAIILTTALAVGVNLAMVGLIDRALLSPPAHIIDPQRVFSIAFETIGPSGEKGLVGTTSFLSFEAIRTAVPDVTPAAWTGSGTSVTVGDQRLAVKSMAVTHGYFSMLGVPARKGRTLVADDDASSQGAAVAVLSHALWQRAFGGDEQVLGRRLKLGGLELDVVGVMPPGFSGHSTERTDLWVPLPTAMRDLPGWQTAPTLAFAQIGVRLAPDQSVSRAAALLTAATGARVVLFPVIGADVAPAPHQIAMWLAGVSLVVLLAGLANGATLSLVRNARRRREASIRASLGATRARLATQVLIESAIVAGLATGVAVILGYWLDEIVRRLLFPFLIESVGMTRRVLVAAAAGGACTLLVTAAAGILQLPPQVTSAELRGTRRGWRRWALRRELLIAQTTLAVVLLTAAGMLGQEYDRELASDQYARIDDVVVAEFARGPGSMSTADQDALLTSAVERVREVPGVAAATVFFVLPYYNVMAPPIEIPGRGEPLIGGELPYLIESTPELLDILRVEVVRGRPFTAADGASAPPVAIVSEAMARTVWPGVSALGKCIRIGLDPEWDPRTAIGPPKPPASAPCREVVGIARDWQPPSNSPAGARRIAHYYVPFAQGVQRPPQMALPRVSGLVLRPESGIDLSGDGIRRAVARGRDDLPLLELRRFAALQRPRLAHWLMGTKLLLLFGALALATAAVGIHAAFAHAVVQRRHEIAVRLAVGASRGDVVLMVLRQGSVVAARGIVAGVIVAILAGWSARSLIVGLESPGPVVIVLTGSLVLVVAILATWIPALTASRAEPDLLLRSE
jgi:predicted permease